MKSPFVLSVVLLMALAHSAFAETTINEDTWRNINRCGANSVFAFLEMLGVDSSYDELVDELEVSKQGATLKDLRDSVAKRGVRCRLVKATPEELTDIPIPAIAHFQVFKDSGHYVVIVMSEKENISCIDGTTAQLSHWKPQEFHERWSGYLLVPDERTSYASLGWMIGVALFFVPIAIYLRGRILA